MDDCYKFIVLCAADFGGQMYKSLLWTCEGFAKILDGYNFDRHVNHVASIVKKYGKDTVLSKELVMQNILLEPGVEYDRLMICGNRVTDIDVLIQMCDYLSANPNVNMTVVKRYPDYPWYHVALLRNKNFVFDDFRDNLRFWWPLLVTDGRSPPNEDIIEHLLKNIDEPWHILLRGGADLLSTWNLLKDINDDRVNGDVWRAVSKSEHVSKEIVAMNPGKPWSAPGLRVNPNMLQLDPNDIFFGHAVMAKVLDMDEFNLIMNAANTYERSYIIDCLCLNRSLTPEMVGILLKSSLDAHVRMISNMSVPVEMLLRKTYAGELSSRDDLTLDMIYDRSDWPWAWEAIVTRVNITDSRKFIELSYQMPNKTLTYVIYNKSITVAVYDELVRRQVFAQDVRQQCDESSCR